MVEIVELIHQKLAARAQDDLFLRHSEAGAAITAVLDLHKPIRIFDECGHDHPYNDDGTLPEGIREIDDVGTVCMDGYMYSICSACCMDSWRGGQTEVCVSEHGHQRDHVACQTVEAIAEKLGLFEAVTTDGQ